MKCTVALVLLLLVLLCPSVYAISFSGRNVPTYTGPFVYIQTDGTINPANVPIQIVGNIYTFTGNVSGSIVIQKDGITLNGAGFFITETDPHERAAAVNASNCQDVTIENLCIGNFNGTGWNTVDLSTVWSYGIFARDSSGLIIENNTIMTVSNGVVVEESSNCKISSNIFLNCFVAVGLEDIENSNITKNTINAAQTYGVALNINSTGNVISDNTILDCAGHGLPCAGILLNGCKSNSINGNYIANTLGNGIQLSDSSQNTIVSNKVVASSLFGLSIDNLADNNQVTNNIFSDGQGAIAIASNVFIGGAPIAKGSSNNNVFTGNIMRNNTFGIDVEGYDQIDFTNYFDTSNKVDDKPVYYWIDRENQIVPTNAGCIYLIDCKNVTVQNSNFGRGQSVNLLFSSNCVVANNNLFPNCAFRVYESSASTINHNNIQVNVSINADINCVISDNTLTGSCTLDIYASSTNTIISNNIQGNHIAIRIGADSVKNNIMNNLMVNNDIGIFFTTDGSNNTVSGNTFANNKNAIYFFIASGNIIYLNNFQNNTKPVDDANFANEPVIWQGHIPFPSNNHWDNGSLGNYWSNYNGTDINGDGIGDTPNLLYVSNQDNYPLMKPVSEPTVPAMPKSTGESSTAINALPTQYIIAILVIAAVLIAVTYVILIFRKKQKSQLLG